MSPMDTRPNSIRMTSMIRMYVPTPVLIKWWYVSVLGAGRGHLPPADYTKITLFPRKYYCPFPDLSDITYFVPGRCSLVTILYLSLRKHRLIKTVTDMKKYICNVCGWVYDPAVGDPDNGIAPGTAFEDLPEDWVCPECGVGKEDFSVEE